MVFRRLDAELTLNTASYSAGLKVMAAETRTFAAAAAESGRAVQAGWETAATGAKTYAATVAETSRANVAARVKEGESLMALRGEYAAIAAAAVKGSAEQVAASRLVDEANKKLIASGLEVKAANTSIATSAAGVAGMFERVGLKVQSSGGLMGSAMKGITADASAMGAGVSAGVAGIVVALAAFEVASIRTFESTASEVRGFQRVTGASAETSSKLIYSFHQLGIEPEAAQRAIGLLSRNLVDHADKVADAGIKVDHFRNGNIDLLSTLLNVGDAYKAAGAGAEGNALAASLLGRGYQSLLPLLTKSREELQGMFADAQKHHLVMDQSDVDTAKEFTLSTRELHAAMQGLEIESARGLVPALTQASGGLTTLIDLADRASRPVGGLGNVIEHLVGAMLPGLAIMDVFSKKQSDNVKVSQDQFLAFTADAQALAGLGVELDDTEVSSSKLTTTHAQLAAEAKRHGEAMVSTAADIGLSQGALTDAIGYQSHITVDAFAAEEAAAKKFAQAVQQGTATAAAALAKSNDSVSFFSSSSLESAAKTATKSADSVEKDDSRVADSIQRVADLQDQFAEKAASDRESYAAKVVQTNERMDAALASYADTVESTNERIRSADDKLAEDRISSAQSVADAEQRLEDDRLAGARSIADAQQKLADEEALQHLSRNPAAAQRLRNQIALRDAEAAIGKAQESASDKERSDLDAVGRAKAAQIQTLAKDQADADRARTEAAKAIQKSEESVTQARAEQVKLAEEGLHLGELTMAQQRQMRDAVAAVGKAEEDSAKQAVTSTAEVSAAIGVTTDDVKKFYETSLADGKTFAEGIRTAIDRGYDPSYVARLMEEGPKQAAPMLALITSQNDNTLRDIVNAGEKALQDQALHLADMNHNVEVAAHSSNAQLRDDFGTAMDLLGLLATRGGHDTAENLARELGIGVEKVKQVAGEYGGALAAGINPVLSGVGAPVLDMASIAQYGADRSYFMSGGGQVPGGYGSRDDVPAMLTKGEVVFSVPAVQRLGADNLVALHDQARKGYAAGGFVTAGDVPIPPDLSAYGDKVGYAGTKVDQFAYDAVVAYMNGGGNQGGSSSAPSGPVPSGEVADWVAAGVALAGKPSSWVPPEVNIAMFESGGDPHAQNNWDSNAAAGTPSKGLMQTIDSTFQAYMVPGHGDIWNPIDNVAAATNYIESRYGDPMNTPGERSLARGGSYQGYGLGGLVGGLNVGVMDRGGFLEPGWNLNYNGLGVREPVGAMAAAANGQGGGGGGDIIVHVTFNGANLGDTPKKIAETLAEPLRAVYARRGRNNTGPYVG
jgi:hypothetical protein